MCKKAWYERRYTPARWVIMTDLMSEKQQLGWATSVSHAGDMFIICWEDNSETHCAAAAVRVEIHPPQERKAGDKALT